MKHLPQEQIKKNKKIFLIENIKGLLKKGNVKEAIKCAKVAGITPRGFGKLVKQFELIIS